MAASNLASEIFPMRHGIDNHCQIVCRLHDYWFMEIATLDGTVLEIAPLKFVEAQALINDYRDEKKRLAKLDAESTARYFANASRIRNKGKIEVY